MANTLGTYDPIIFAQEALIQLEKALGMGARVHRGFEKSPQTKGSSINIRRPADITVSDAPATAQDLATETVSVQLTRHKEGKFKLTDKELTFTGDIIIDEHMRRTAYKLADEIDQTLNGLHTDIPWFYDYSGTPVVGDVTGIHQVLFDNGVPMEEGMIHLEINGAVQAGLLGLPAFTQHQGAGLAGVESQLRGTLGTRYGMEIFANQNVKTHTKGTASTGTLAVNNGAGYAAGVTTMNIDAATVTGTLVPGDTFSIAGHTQRYAITNTTTAASNAFTGVSFTPGLEAAVADNAVITVNLDNHGANIAFHHDAFALAMAPLSTIGDGLGVRMATVFNDKSNIALRTRIFYVGNDSAVYCAVDVLYGVKTLNPNLAAKLRS